MLFRQHLLGSCSLLACLPLLAAPTLAADETITGDETTALVTSTRLGTSSGTLTLDEGASISVSSGTAIWVDGNHTLDLSGALSNTGTMEARGIFYDAAVPLDSDLTLAGSIAVGDSDTDTLDLDATARNIGIEFTGAAGLTGNVTFADTATVFVYGGDSTGVQLGTALMGNMTIDGSVSITGNRSTGITLSGPLDGAFINSASVDVNGTEGIGILVSAPISGQFTHESFITVGTAAAVDADGNAVDVVSGGAGLVVQSDIMGGLLFEGIGTDNTGTDDNGDAFGPSFDSSISAYGTAPGVRIGSTENSLTIGLLPGDDYGFVHRGSITATGSSTGVAALGMEFFGASQSAQTTIDGGMHFDTGVLRTLSYDAETTGMVLGDWASTPLFYNNGTIDIDSFRTSDTVDDVTTYGPGGDAFGLIVEENGSLTAFKNDGFFHVNAGGDTAVATGVWDKSGSLTTIENSGYISASMTDNTALSGTAFDLSANASGVTLANSGSIIGDIRLGNGADTLTISDGQIIGDIDFGSGKDHFIIRGEAEFGGTYSYENELHLDFAETSLVLSAGQNLTATTGSFGENTHITLQIDPSNGSHSQLVFTDSLTLADTVSVQPVITSLQVSENNFVLIDAAVINASDLSSNFQIEELPYLFDVSLTEQTDAGRARYILDIDLKTPETLGLAGNDAVLYNALTSSNTLDDGLDRSLAGISSDTEAVEALAALLPDISNATFDIELTRLRLHEENFSSRIKNFVQDEHFGGGMWARESVSIAETRASTSLLDGDITYIDLALGYDSRLSDHFAWGLSTAFALAGQTRENKVGADLSRFSMSASLYGMWHVGGLYAGLDLGVTTANTDRERLMEFGSVNREAESGTSGFGLNATLEAGYDLQAGGFHLTPFARLSWMKFNESSYNETGADSANFDIESRSITYKASTIGVSLGYDINWKRKSGIVILRPELFASKTTQLGTEDGTLLSATFTESGESFSLFTEALDGDAETFGAGINLFNRDFSSYVGYRQDRRDGYTAHSATVNFRLKF